MILTCSVHLLQEKKGASHTKKITTSKKEITTCERVVVMQMDTTTVGIQKGSGQCFNKHGSLLITVDYSLLVDNLLPLIIIK